MADMGEIVSGNSPLNRLKAEARDLRIFTLHTSAIAIFAVLSVSCVNEEAAEPESSMNQTQAEEQIQAYATNAAGELPMDVDLSSVNEPAFPVCEGETGDKNRTVQVRHSFWVDGAPEEKNEEMADSLHALWEAGHWEITRDDRPERIQIEATNREDQFRMKLLVGQDGRPSLSGYSPCVQADENP